jgi:DNA polymerase III epsilon subunit-like protein
MIFSVIDCETTGLPVHPDGSLSQQPKIIEFAAILTDGSKILDEIEFKVNPGELLDAEITKITGIRDADLVDALPWGRHIQGVREHFKHSRGRVAHNLAFDRAMLFYAMQRENGTLDDISYHHDAKGRPAIEICTVEQSFFEYGRRMRLQELIERVKGAYVQRHRALDDVRQLFEVATEMGVFEAFSECV